MQIVRFLLALLVPVVVTAGCSGGPQVAPKFRSGCEDAVARAAGQGKASATAYAKSALKYEVQDLKGFMLKDGYRSVRPQSQRVDCKPYPLGGLTLCVATARLCSH